MSALLTVKAVSKRLGLSKSLVYSLIQAGIIRAMRHGKPGCRGTYRVTEEAMNEYLESCQPPEDKSPRY